MEHIQNSIIAETGQEQKQTTSKLEMTSSNNTKTIFTLDDYDESKYTKFSFFWLNDNAFSQWHPSSFKVGENTFTSAEQFMMYEKALLFNDTKVAQQILKSSSPKTQKALGRKVDNFDQKIWDRHCCDIVYRGNYAKFSQNPHLKEQLLALQHRDREFVEASPRDKIWGIGMEASDAGVKHRENWKGLNLLGKVLTCVRDDILKQDQQQ